MILPVFVPADQMEVLLQETIVHQPREESGRFVPVSVGVHVVVSLVWVIALAEGPAAKVGSEDAPLAALVVIIGTHHAGGRDDDLEGGIALQERLLQPPLLLLPPDGLVWPGRVGVRIPVRGEIRMQLVLNGTSS